MATDAEGREDYFGAAILSGAADIADSTVSLQPAETARIRIPATVSFGGDERVRLDRSRNQPVTVRAQLMLTMAPCRWAEPVVSTNSVSVTFRK